MRRWSWGSNLKTECSDLLAEKENGQVRNQSNNIHLELHLSSFPHQPHTKPILNLCSRLQAPRNCTGIRDGGLETGRESQGEFWVCIGIKGL